jgi:hypothetical protein
VSFKQLTTSFRNAVVAQRSEKTHAAAGEAGSYTGTQHDGDHEHISRDLLPGAISSSIASSRLSFDHALTSLELRVVLERPHKHDIKTDFDRAFSHRKRRLKLGRRCEADCTDFTTTLLN